MKNTYDLIVVGGGFAGAVAAMSAARHGVDVLLIERYNCLGGAAAGCLVMPFMNYFTKDEKGKLKEYLCGGIFLEILDEMKALSGRTHEACMITFDEELLKLVLNRLCIKYGVHLLFNTTVTEAVVKDGNVCAVKAMSSANTMEFSAKYFIDATGDAELCVLAGCECKLGREKDSLCQPMTLNFRMYGVDMEKYQKNKSKIDPLYKEFKEKGLIKNPREDVLIFDTVHDGILHFNTTRIVKKNPTDPFDVTEAEIEAREQVFEVHRFLKENIEGFENTQVLSTAMHIGIRESRKVVGEYVLKQEELKALTRFEDGIASANYDIDIHNPEGSGTSHFYFKGEERYEIPYRCLIPKGMHNLLVAGRCISSTHEAQASYRVMPFCAEIGQAAGVAVAVAKENGTDTKHVDVAAVRTILKNEGFIL